MKEVLRLDGITKVYEMGQGVKVEALRGVDLTVMENEYVSILGPSGSGKSTLLHIMGLLDSPTSGKRFVDGIETSKMNEQQQARVRDHERDDALGRQWATVSPIAGCRSAVATTSMLMLPATKTRPMKAIR